MTVTAQHVAAAIREHLPGTPAAKLHKLLYYVQGHHLALFGRPAFAEAVVASDDGPAVDGLSDVQPISHVPGALGPSVLNVVLHVATRYGQLTTTDLSRLARAETPWRSTGRSEPIDHGALDLFFSTDGAQDGAKHDSPEHLAWLREEVSKARARGSARPDNLADLLAKVAGRDQR